MENKFILGTVQFGLDYGITNKTGKINNEELNKIFDFCYENQIFYFDTAQDYGNSEDIMSNISRKYNDFKIITKCKFKNKNIDETIKISLDKFEKIECFLLHSFDDYLNNEIINVLQKNKKEQKINKIGVSVYTVNEAIKILEDNIIDVIQIPFNYVDNQWLNLKFQTLLQENKKIEIHVRSIFLQGLLLNPINKIPINIPIEDFNLLNKKIQECCDKFSLSKSELCFAYINSFTWINHFLIGVDNFEHLKNNFNEIKKNVKLSIEDIKYINEKMLSINQDIVSPLKWIFN